jgi:hypothetical protein
VVSKAQRLVLIRADRVRVVRPFPRLAGLSVGLGVIIALGGCAATGVTLRSNHFRLAVPPDLQVIEPGGGGEIPTLVRAPASGGAPEVDVRLYPWLVSASPADPAGDVLERLAAINVLGLGSAHADDAEPCPDRAAQFFVFGKPARAIHLTNSEGRRIVVTAGEAYGSLVAVVGALAPGASGCVAVERMDAIVERLAASMTEAADLSRPTRPPTLTYPTSPIPPPNVDPTAPP